MSLQNAASQVLDLLRAGYYEFEGGRVRFGIEQEAAVKGTRLYTPDELADLRVMDRDEKRPRVEVIDGTTQEVAFQLAGEKENARDLALLNFASARNPGGGFLNGAKAQEEDLCRCSGLYPALITCMTYYEANRKQDSLLYTDHTIYSPSVPFFKTHGTGPLLEKPFLVSVITAPAPNTRPYLESNPNMFAKLEETFLRRWENVLAVGRDNNIKRLLLGAWGCGAFGGDPEMAARTAKIAIANYGSSFDQIIFGIPDRGRQSKDNFNAFQREFR